MRIQIKATHFELTEAIRARVEEKLSGAEKLLSRVEERDQEDEKGEESVLARVEVGRTTRHHNKGEVYKAEVHLEIPGQPSLYVESVEEDLLVAIDQVQEQLEREIRQSQEKHRDAIRKGGREAKEMMNQYPPDLADEDEEQS